MVFNNYKFVHQVFEIEVVVKADNYVFSSNLAAKFA
jgi:hypothetical protein